MKHREVVATLIKITEQLTIALKSATEEIVNLSRQLEDLKRRVQVLEEVVSTQHEPYYQNVPGWWQNPIVSYKTTDTSNKL